MYCMKVRSTLAKSDDDGVNPGEKRIPALFCLTTKATDEKSQTLFNLIL